MDQPLHKLARRDVAEDGRVERRQSKLPIVVVIEHLLLLLFPGLFVIGEQFSGVEVDDRLFLHSGRPLRSDERDSLGGRCHLQPGLRFVHRAYFFWRLSRGVNLHDA